MIVDGILSALEREDCQIPRKPENFWDGFCHCPKQKKKDGTCEICGGPING